MLRSLLPLLLVLTGCAKKSETNTAAAADAPKEETIDGAKYPDDANSKAFVEKLIKHDATNFKPTDAGAGASFIYKTIDFKADNTWWAAAQMTADGETIDCKEQGTWELDPATDEHTAAMTWKLNRSSCAGRPSDDTLRLKVGIDKGEYRIVFR
jgi:hypothetical protein